MPTRLMAGARRHGREQGKSDPDRRPRGRPGGAREPGPAGRHARGRGARAAAPGRPPRGPRRRADPGAEPPALAPPRARPRQRARPPEPRPGRRPAGARRAPRGRPGHRRPDRPRARRPDPRADPHDRRPRARDHAARPRGRPDPARPARLRPALGGQARRRGRRHRPLPLGRRLRPPQRLGTAAGLVGQRRAPPAVAQGQPPGQRRPPPDRHHPDADRRARPGLLRAPSRRGDTKTEAIRALKRRISDEVYRRMRHDERLRATPRAALAAAA